MQVKMLTTGPNGNYAKGAIVDVDAGRARILIESGHAEAVCCAPSQPTLPAAIAASAECAMVELPARNAATRTGKLKGR